jgi:preprotein translocase subunit SecE
VNRETKRLMQRQGQMEADGSPATRKAPAGANAGGPRQPRSRQQGRKRTTPVQFVREVRDEMRQVAWPSRSELINYTSVVLTTLIIMITLIFFLNLAFGKLVTLLFTK